jgi:hypothetical protein
MIGYILCKKEEERILAIFLYEQRNKKECKGRTLMMTPRREINRHEKRRESECEREKNRHMHTSGKAISVIKTDEK